MNPQVAVITAAYNPGPYLDQALASLQAQTSGDWECVVIDDGSTQDLTWVADLDPRIRLIRQDNAGVSAARNAGVAATSAPLVAFLDQDDGWAPTYLTDQVAQFADPSIGLSSTDFEIMDREGRVVGPGFGGPHHRSYAELLTGCGLMCSTVMVRRDVLDTVGGFRNFPVSQDWDLWLRIARTGAGIARVDQIGGRWRRHASNASLDYRGLRRDGLAILAEHDHPAARIGAAHIRHLAGVQAFDAARASRGKPLTLASHLVYALRDAPAYTVGSLLRRPRGSRAMLSR